MTVAGRLRTGLPGVVVLAALACGVALAPPTRAGDDYDPVVATLLASGRDALAKRKYDAALEFLDKVLEEDAGAIEALYWKAQALEKLERPHDALQAYRAFLALYEVQKADDEASAAETGLATKAAAREERLGEGERELARLNEAFAKKLVTFAESIAEDDPALARDALQKALAADSGNPAAIELLAGVGGEAADAGEQQIPPGPFAALVKGEWHDLIARKSLGTGTPSYSDGRMTLDFSGGKVVNSSERIRLAENYVYEADLRVLEEHSRGWLAGLVVGWSGGNFYSVFFQEGQVVLNRGHAKMGPQEDLDRHPLPPLPSNRWSRLGVRVRGKVLQVWFDGKLVITYEVEDAALLQADIAVFQQRCKAEYRVLRAAATE